MAMSRSSNRAGHGSGVAEGREELQKIDRELVLLLAARLRTVERLWRVKRDLGLPLEAREQERKVRTRARGWAVEEGIDPDLVERVFEIVVAHGKARAVRELGGPEVLAPRTRSTSPVRGEGQVSSPE